GTKTLTLLGKHYEESPYGFLSVESTRWNTFAKEFIEAGKELGYPEIDANGPQTQGFGPLEVTQRNGERYGTYAAIIKDLYLRDSVKILTYSQVTKIKLNKSGRAVGIYYHRHGKRKYAMADKEIIISAGAVDSPKLLMLSGIGPKTHLESVDIKTKVDLPVGQNLEDHLVAGLVPFTVESSGVFASLDKVFGPAFVKEYHQNRRGPLTVAAGLVAQGFLCSENIFKENYTKCEWPDIQIYFAPLSYFRLMNTMLSRAVNIDYDLLNVVNPPTEKEGFHFLISVVRPNSKGELTLREKDPFALPLINPRYLEDPKDLNIMLQGFKLMMKMAENTTVFQDLGTKYIGSPVPGCAHLKFRSDDYWKCYIQHFSVTMWHPTGTCKMGRDASDKTAVVDSRLRVLHTRGMCKDYYKLPLYCKKYSGVPVSGRMGCQETPSSPYKEQHSKTVDAAAQDPAIFVECDESMGASEYLSSLWEEEPPDLYDFIIVGAGSSGATIAERLSKNYRVLLVEAGGHPFFFSSIPAIALDFTHFPQWDWMHRTVPQKNAAMGMKNKISNWPRGKVLGGSSTLNFMLYLRGHPKDYDNWAKITNDSEWNYENVLPYFKKSLKYYSGNYKSNKKHYEESPYGFLSVEAPEFKVFQSEFIAAGKELGYPEIDANGPQTEGFGPLEVTEKNGARYGTYAAIIKGLFKRENVRILTYSQVTKVKLDDSGRAVGIHYHRFGKRKYARAAKEIIISGGTVDSPKLLMLSGIGPKSHLESVGIKPKIDLPVGKNLEDHFVTSVEPFMTETKGVFIKLDEQVDTVVQEYISNGTGVLSIAFGLVAQGFLCSESIRNNSIKCDWPDIQIYLSPISYFSLSNKIMTRASNFEPEILSSINPETEKEGFHFLVSLVRPHSKGEITLKDKDPFSLPLINPNYLEDPKDLDILLQGLKEVLRLCENTTVFQKIGTKFSGTPLPGYKDAVVDSRLRVLHTRGLRVADASIMPVMVLEFQIFLQHQVVNPVLKKNVAVSTDFKTQIEDCEKTDNYR
ncbi:unnamed protein product, partial [Allacma fusca]